MTDKTNTPEEITETKLDEISGGPHWQTMDSIGHFSAATNETETIATSSGHYTQMAWAKTR